MEAGSRPGASCRPRTSRVASREARLAGRRDLFGDLATKTDTSHFVIPVRFDAAYHGLFKCNLRRIVDYPTSSRHVEIMLALPGVSIAHSKRGHDSIKALNPNGIVPLGPEPPFATLQGGTVTRSME